MRKTDSVVLFFITPLQYLRLNPVKSEKGKGFFETLYAF